MSASGDGIPVKLNTYVEENTKVKPPSKQEKSDISPALFTQKCTVSSPKDEREKSELRDPIPPQTSADCADSFEISEEQTESTNIEDSSSPSNSLNDRFKRMHFTVPKINYTEKIVSVVCLYPLFLIKA